MENRISELPNFQAGTGDVAEERNTRRFARSQRSDRQTTDCKSETKMTELMFPPIETLTFEPSDDHFDFCDAFNVGMTLLHSHEGVSELLFYDKFT